MTVDCRNLSGRGIVVNNVDSLRLASLAMTVVLAIVNPFLVGSLNPQPLQAQTPVTPDIIQPAPPLPEIQIPPTLPPPEDLLQTPLPTAPIPTDGVALPSQIPGNITVERFEVVGSSAFSQKTLAEAVAPFTKKPITFAEMLEAAAAITKLYAERGYVTSGAFIPSNQTFQTSGGVVRIEVIEGSTEDILVTGTTRLNPNYVLRRIAVAASTPLNTNKLLEAVQLLQLNPLIQTISVELAAGSRPGTSLIDVKVTEAKTSSAQIDLNNNRVPTIGTFERQLQLNDANWLGFGDNLNFAYANTDGSNSINFNYTLPVTARNATLSLSYGYATTQVIEPPFDILDINGTSQNFGLTFRQPLIQTPTQEFALGLTASRQSSDVGFLQALTGVRLGFPSPGADEQGRTRISALRFFQDWSQRNSQQVIAARSQFSLGIGAFDATINQNEPDSRFFSWRGQGQYVRLLAPDTLLLLRGDIQVASNALVPLEQIGLGGQETVRGYRQDFLLTDNAAFASAELRYPVLRVPQINGLLQITPFFDFGRAWNNAGNAAMGANTIGSVGLGLRWQQSDNVSARLDYGIPLFSVPNERRTLQEKGLHFSIIYNQSF